MSEASIAVYIFGGAFIVFNAFLLFFSEETLAVLRKFPRSRIPGIIFTAISTCWFAYLLSDNIPFEALLPFKNLLVMIAGLMCIPIILLMDELLAVRSLGFLLLLAGAPMLNAIRFQAYPYTWPITIMVYVLMIMGMFFILSPWKFRRWVKRFYDPAGSRHLCGWLGLGFGFMSVVIGFLYL